MGGGEVGGDGVCERVRDRVARWRAGELAGGSGGSGRIDEGGGWRMADGGWRRYKPSSIQLVGFWLDG